MEKSVPRTCWCRGPLVLFLAGAVTTAGVVWAYFPRQATSGWSDAVLLTLALGATVAALARHLPVQNILMGVGIAAALGGGAHAVNEVIGLPFGRFEFGPAFGPRWFGVLSPAIMGVWAATALTARGAARALLHNSRQHPRHGYRVVGLATLLGVLFMAGVNPVATQVKGWLEANPTPWLNLIGLAIVSLFIQIAVTAVLIDKFPGRRPPNFWPVLVWVCLEGWLAVVLAGSKLWLEAAIPGAAAVVALALAGRVRAKSFAVGMLQDSAKGSV
jgi:hypothetical protein